MTDVWTTERVDQLRALYLDPINDWSNAEIAAKIGGITRNSVIGKASRLGLQKPNTSRKAKAHQVKPKPVRKSRAPLPPGAPKFNPQPFVCAEPVDIVPLNIAFHDLQDGDCKWPYDAPHGSSISHVFCGHPALEDKPYCVGHTIKAKAPAQPRGPSKPSPLGQSRGGVFGRVA